MSDALAFNISFLHPFLMWVLLALSTYAMLLGVKAKKTRTATPEERKDLIKGKFAQRHYRYGSLVLSLMILGSLGGMAVTYINNSKLFVSPHLLVGLAMTGMISIAAALSPLMQQGSIVARKAHVGLNMGLMTLFLWQAFTGMQIANKIWTSQ
uniref:DUF4079 domain-containing protein n=1 Tax=Paulinella longichromatophora TaxID=1708747 RepID=A0A2H4ZPM9_9EUKA|nr:hypothetical protein PLO_504 [Paulinella longichromatophora]